METHINLLLHKLTSSLACYLEKSLPSLFENWWQQAVVQNLSFQQKRHLEQNNIVSLASLDIAALLRVFDQNWFQLSNKLNLTQEARHYIKELQTIRNRWAHIGSEDFTYEDKYRDLDTLQRFALIIGAEDNLIQEVRAAKASFLPQHVDLTAQIESADKIIPQVTKAKSFEFEPGQIIYLKSNSSVRGAVVSVVPGSPENRFKVFVDGAVHTFYASQMVAEDQSDEDSQLLPCDHFHSCLTALQIRHPGLSTLYSLNAARVDFIPYQFRPVLKFIRSDRPRLLIADGVGVGKTIEAGLILRELQARRDINSILIICPRPLVTEKKWQNEMKRFEERFTHLDGNTLRYCINEMDLEGVWPEQHKKVIVPYSLFDETLLYGTDPDSKRKRKTGLLNLDPPPRFDLVIVDEAHHIRNKDTFSHKAVNFFCEHAEAVVFLTATPIQLGNMDLFVLLNVLRPDIIIDRESFEHMSEPNPFINNAVSFAREQDKGWNAKVIQALDAAAATSCGQAILQKNPEFIRIRSLIAGENITSEERVKLITDLESFHTFSGIINRTRRRDIGDFTIRKPDTVAVEFTPSQRELHDDILRIQAEIYSKIQSDINVAFIMTTIRRQAASCLYGLVPFLEEILSRHLDEISWEESDNEISLPQGESIAPLETRIREILEKAKKLDPCDSKYEALRKIINDKQKLQNNKIMLFSSFRHTLRYLFEHLKNDGLRIGMIHGGTPDEERISLRSRFEQSREKDDCLDILLFSEIGCEGLDYQFCDCIVNYDLPWNPMRIEQRIGRIDRKGQKSESVAIVNMITPGTVDADIYERCLLRIGIFNNAIGCGEEILGEITQEIRNIAENLSLDDEDRKLKFQQLADNNIRLIQEQNDLEQRQLELFGIRLPEDQMKQEIEDASSFWLSPQSIRRLVDLYLRQTCGKDQEFILGEKSLKTIRLAQEARNSLLNDFQKLHRQNNSSYRDWENWLKGGNQHLIATFDSDCAMQHPEAIFITPIHPLVKQAAMSLDSKQRIITALKVKSELIPEGTYEFAIYQWSFHGIKEDQTLRSVASSDILSEHLINLLETATDVSQDMPEKQKTPEWKDLDAQHYMLWSEARTKHQNMTREHAKFRRESLKISHQARIRLLEEQRDQNASEKIKKMRQSQISSAEADYARRIQDLDIAMERADITASIVAYGIITIVKGE